MLLVEKQRKERELKQAEKQRKERELKQATERDVKMTAHIARLSAVGRDDRNANNVDVSPANKAKLAGGKGKGTSSDSSTTAANANRMSKGPSARTAALAAPKVRGSKETAGFKPLTDSRLRM